MRFIRLDHTGHTELDLAPEEMIAELEKEMNQGNVVIVEEPGKEASYLRSPKDFKATDPGTQVTVMPQLQGG